MADTKRGREKVTTAVVERQQRNDQPVDEHQAVVVRRSALDQFLLTEGHDAASRGLKGTGVDPEAFLRAVATVVAQSSLNVSPDERVAQQQYRSVLVAAMNVATLRLAPAPQVGHSWFVPFWDGKLKAQKCQLIVGYQGFVTLAGRAGWSMKAEPLWEGQRYRINLARPEDTLIEPLDRMPDEGEKPERMAFIAWGPGGLTGTVTARPYDWYLAARERSESYKRDLKAQREGKSFRPGPWMTDELAMVAKTVIRRERKFVPMDPAGSLDAARLAFAFIADGSVGGRGELPPADPMNALLWTPDSYDSDAPMTEAERVGELDDATLMAEIVSYEAGANCAGADVSNEVDSLIHSHGMDPGRVVPILAGEDGPLPPRELLVGIVQLCRAAASSAAAEGES